VPKGITNKQAKLLAELQRRAGEQYSGSGMTRWQASEEISRLLAAQPQLAAAIAGDLAKHAAEC
jgi:hypothetical protein